MSQPLEPGSIADFLDPRKKRNQRKPSRKKKRQLQNAISLIDSDDSKDDSKKDPKNTPEQVIESFKEIVILDNFSIPKQFPKNKTRITITFEPLNQLGAIIITREPEHDFEESTILTNEQFVESINKFVNSYKKNNNSV